MALDRQGGTTLPDFLRLLSRLTKRQGRKSSRRLNPKSTTVTLRQAMLLDAASLKTASIFQRELIVLELKLQPQKELRLSFKGIVSASKRSSSNSFIAVMDMAIDLL